MEAGWKGAAEAMWEETPQIAEEAAGAQEEPERPMQQQEQQAHAQGPQDSGRVQLEAVAADGAACVVVVQPGGADEPCAEEAAAGVAAEAAAEAAVAGAGAGEAGAPVQGHSSQDSRRGRGTAAAAYGVAEDRAAAGHAAARAGQLRAEGVPGGVPEEASGHEGEAAGEEVSVAWEA